MNYKITGTGSCIPDITKKNTEFLNNSFYDDDGNQIQSSNPDIIEKFQSITGINERKYVSGKIKSSDLAAVAAEKAIEDSKIDQESLDYIIVAHNFGDISCDSTQIDTLPSLASKVKTILKIRNPKCVAYDIICGCPGWVEGVIQAKSFIKSGMANKFLVGGSEAPLTDFTIAQMRALKIYSKNNDKFPCRALDLNKKQNSLVLGEGAAVCCIELGRTEKTIAVVEGIGFATEILEHNVSVSAEATCFQKSMKMALENTKLSEVDAIVMHAPGTIKGDLSEYKAIQKIFGEKLPLLTTNKWKIGHTFGASGMLSIEMAILMLQNQTFIGVPFAEAQSQKKPLKKILVNAVGFGGNAVSVLLGL
jgi:3-oxoacyl-(acyl-carrier-protein) synthase